MKVKGRENNNMCKVAFFIGHILSVSPFKQFIMSVRTHHCPVFKKLQMFEMILLWAVCDSSQHKWKSNFPFRCWCIYFLFFPPDSINEICRIVHTFFLISAAVLNHFVGDDVMMLHCNPDIPQHILSAVFMQNSPTSFWHVNLPPKGNIYGLIYMFFCY